MTDGFVKVPNRLLDDAGLSDRALRLWVVVRRRNGEREFRGCWQGAAGLDGTMPAHGRRKVGTDCQRCKKGAPWAFKAAQSALVERGLMVVRRRSPGSSALRWALSPGVDGSLELNDLLQRGQIGEQLHQETQARRAAYRPQDGRMANHLEGG